ncbi:MAG: hypothetical protein IJ278_02570 [Clostridia bacterium]|nr:hypothetical protein [Clostridia bacterium]
MKQKITALLMTIVFCITLFGAMSVSAATVASGSCTALSAGIWIPKEP